MNVDQDYLRTIIMCKFLKEKLRGVLKKMKRVDKTKQDRLQSLAVLGIESRFHFPLIMI